MTTAGSDRHDIQRVSFSEGDDVCEVADVADCVDAFRQAKAADFSENVIGVVVSGCENGDSQIR